MAKIILVFKCGCREYKHKSTYNYAKKIVNGEKKTIGYTCRVCGTPVDYQMTYCVEQGCGAELHFQMNGRPSLRCEKHAKEQTRRVRKLAMRRYRERMINMDRGTGEFDKKELEVRTPIRISSVMDAQKKNINCIPLDRLFRIYKKIA